MRKTTGIIGGLVALAASLWAAVPAMAAGPCDHLQSAFAYNECLAKQTPGRAPRGPRAGTGGGDPSIMQRRRATEGLAPDQNAPGIRIQRRPGRRASAVIDPWAGTRYARPRR